MDKFINTFSMDAEMANIIDEVNDSFNPNLGDFVRICVDTEEVENKPERLQTVALFSRSTIQRASYENPLVLREKWFSDSLNDPDYKKNERICRKRTHAERVLNDMSSLLAQPDESFADVKIISGDGKEFKAHKCILAARSPVFKPMLTNGMEESKSGVIRIDDLSGHAVDALLHFIYTCKILPFLVEEKSAEEKEGEAASGKLLIGEILHAATKYQIADLIEYFDDKIGSFCNGANAIFLLQLANKFSLLKGQAGIKQFIKDSPHILDKILDNQ